MSAVDNPTKAVGLAIATVVAGIAVGVFVLLSVLSSGSSSIVFVILAVVALAGMIPLFFYRPRGARHSK